ncbi:MAG: acetyl-CoA carboxylase biotin carboxyl carrier protein [Gemmatimonadota bacterium]
MIDLAFLESLIRTLDESGLDHVEIERGGTRVRVSRSPAPIQWGGASDPQPGGTAGGGPPSGSPAAGPPAAEPSGAESSSSSTPASLPDHLVEVTSPMVGTFYRGASPEAEPFADVGKRVAKGDVLCIIEAMKLMNEFEADIDGIIREVCVSNGEPVEYGQALFRIEPA